MLSITMAKKTRPMGILEWLAFLFLLTCVALASGWNWVALIPGAAFFGVPGVWFAWHFLFELDRSDD